MKIETKLLMVQLRKLKRRCLDTVESLIDQFILVLFLCWQVVNALDDEFVDEHGDY
jgi:hypothetical protein